MGGHGDVGRLVVRSREQYFELLDLLLVRIFALQVGGPFDTDAYRIQRAVDVLRSAKKPQREESFAAETRDQVGGDARLSDGGFSRYQHEAATAAFRLGPPPQPACERALPGEARSQTARA